MWDTLTGVSVKLCIKIADLMMLPLRVIRKIFRSVYMEPYNFYVETKFQVGYEFKQVKVVG